MLSTELLKPSLLTNLSDDEEEEEGVDAGLGEEDEGPGAGANDDDEIDEFDEEEL